jgi:hypothetical protein
MPQLHHCKMGLMEKELKEGMDLDLRKEEVESGWILSEKEQRRLRSPIRWSEVATPTVVMEVEGERRGALKMGRSSLSGLAGKRFRFWIVSIIVAMRERERWEREVLNFV